jgi:transcriptional regulator
MRQYLKRILLIGLSLTIAGMLAPAMAAAHPGHDHEADSQKRAEALRLRLEELKQQRQASQDKRLEANKLRQCEQRQQNIAAILKRSLTRAENQLELFDSIAGRVKAFYVKKGNVLHNYDELVASADAAKAKAEADIATLKALPAFVCDADDPKGSAEAFKLAHQTIIEDLKKYRTAVKDLIIGVKSVQSTARRSGGEQ